MIDSKGTRFGFFLANEQAEWALAQSKKRKTRKGKTPGRGPSASRSGSVCYLV